MTAQLVADFALEKQTWTWQGYNIKYVVQGTGQPLVLIHGFGASSGHWRKNIPVLAAAGYQVFALDLLGFGGSEKPAIAYSLDLWQDLLKDFWTVFIQRPAVFVGNSIGGLLAMMMLANHPEIAAGGILLNAAGGLNHRPDELPPPLRLVMGSFTKLVSSNWAGPLLFNQVRQKHRIRGSLRQVYGNKDAITDELIDMLHQPALEAGAQKVFAAILTAPPGPRPIDLLPLIQQPLLVIWGEDDPWTPIKGAEVYKTLSTAVDGQSVVTFHSIPKTGHCPHDERPDVVNALMIDWLATLAAFA
ncbi:alpha/beta fold hydrolase [Pseudanabaena sp. FACHB-2040]|uniref:alpha/beta fold hydrolase n=1 Tax=Pseudanabaena sp. FACHB-2040 TaxID=2692859 RepID=UPI001685D805|nr:alpha/beta fold hydrolase [Pseudanabaena sp. FACHB-2040]MBD2260280.1 alpha/beta fold hydrolase [Pseudanabaena sp. FACHB-2040]